VGGKGPALEVGRRDLNQKQSKNKKKSLGEEEVLKREKRENGKKALR